MLRAHLPCLQPSIYRHFSPFRVGGEVFFAVNQNKETLLHFVKHVEIGGIGIFEGDGDEAAIELELSNLVIIL